LTETIPQANLELIEILWHIIHALSYFLIPDLDPVLFDISMIDGGVGRELLTLTFG